ncbi:MFS transporter [Thalassoroseus pseudoceratinae]|uniref:MFS transporter n=1 Tax=Thalassoroseus pseudoceratinae TaxID=2713176 RepID=UPI0014233213|nr:MFS transporter [Thalassoroseus pseudoceratinae]
MKNRPTRIRYRVLAWLTLAAALAYLCRNVVGVVESSIRNDLGLTLQQSGWFMGAFFWTYAVFQVPAGWFAERNGTRIAISIFVIGSSLAMIGMSVAESFWLLVLAQLVMGVAQAGLFPASCQAVGHWMPLAQRSLACGILAAGMQVGAILASWLSGRMLLSMSWRWVFVLFAVPGILWTITFLRRYRNFPDETPSVNEAELQLIRANSRPSENQEDGDTNELQELEEISRNPVMWWLCGQQICRAAGYMFFASWFPTFLQKTRGVSVEESGYLQGVVLAGTLLGSVFGGVIIDWIWRKTGSLRLSRSGMGAASLGTCALLILAAWFIRDVNTAIALLAMGALFAAIAGPCAFATTIDIGGERVPQVFGIMNMSGNFAAAACPVLVATLFEWTENWNLVLVMFAGVYFVGAICWLFANPEKRIASETAA